MKYLISYDPHEELTTYNQIWIEIMLWNMGGVGFLYFIAGIFAAMTFRPKLKWALVIPFSTTVLGAVIGLCEGIIYALVIALVYKTGTFKMERYMAFIWGLSLSAYYVVFSFSRLLLRS